MNADVWKEKVLTLESLRTLLKNKTSNNMSKASHDLLDEADYEFVSKYHCSYNFVNDGIELLNSDSEDMRWTIDDFIKSGCRDWDEFSDFLIEDYIAICKRYLIREANQ
jgi:hypothetical protein